MKKTAPRKPKQKPPSTARWKERLRKAARIAGWCALAFLLLSIIQVVLCRFVDPPFTPLMGIRRLEGWWATGRMPPAQYDWIDLEDAPKDFVRFVWVSEDARFFRHHGFDLVELRITLREAWREKRAPRGASTITMQCARSLFLWQGRSWLRKVLEAYYTVLLEIFLSKERILELYINVIEMGNGVYGIEAAARHHYQSPSHALSQSELAMLVAILPNPRAWDPRRPTERVQRRQKVILERASRVRLPPALE